jgi:hypothetical protein
MSANPVSKASGLLKMMDVAYFNLELPSLTSSFNRSKETSFVNPGNLDEEFRDVRCCATACKVGVLYVQRFAAFLK